MREANSTAGERLLQRKDRILEVWEARVRAEIPTAARQPHPILINTFPRLMQYLAGALSPCDPRQSATEGTTIAQEHGGERVRLTGYTLGDMMREYQLLREVLFEELAPTADERQVIVRSIDASIREACSAFALVSEQIREKFTLTLAHDLRSPLTAARAGAQLILARPDSADVPRWAARIVDAIDRVDVMIRDLLDVSRVGAGRRLEFDLAECDLVVVARHVIEQLELIHGQRFVFRPKKKALRGFWGEAALRRAIENLLTNGIKYGSRDRPVTLTLEDNHQRVQLAVHNEGSYIPPEEQEGLFQVFGRTHTAQRGRQAGWGLGLALARAVSEAHGGSIEVLSTPELGTTFTLDFPVDARPFQDSATTPDAAPAPRK